MSKLLAFVHLDDPASLKRALVTLLGIVLMLCGPLLEKWGLPKPSDVQLELVAGILAAFVLQSGVKSAVVAHAEAQFEKPPAVPVVVKGEPSASDDPNVG